MNVPVVMIFLYNMEMFSICYELGNNTGEYYSLEECELNCLISDTTWKCNNGFCIEFMTQAENTYH